MKFLEDFEVGQRLHFSSPGLSRAQIMQFAREWDPQRLHLDEDYASAIHGSLIASGFQTMLAVFQPIMAGLMRECANIGGIGLDELRWLRPVRPDEPLSIELVVRAVTPSRSKPDRGVMTYAVTATNPAGEVVLTCLAPVMMRRRPDAD